MVDIFASNKTYSYGEADDVWIRHGKHACPGRFFAANEIKILLVYALMNYDIKIPDGTEQLPSIWYSKSRTPNQDGEVCFRYREGGDKYSNCEVTT